MTIGRQRGYVQLHVQVHVNDHDKVNVNVNLNVNVQINGRSEVEPGLTDRHCP